MLKYSVALLLFLSLLLPSLSHALDFRYSINTSAQDSNNVTQRVGGGEGKAYTAGFDFTLNSSATSEWNINAASQFLLTKYSISGDDDLEDEKNKNFQGVVRYDPSGTNFFVNFLANVSQAPRNRFSIEGVNNLRDIQTLAANPSYFIRLNPADRLNFSANVIKLKSDDGEQSDGIILQNDSRKVYEYATSYQKRLTEINTLALNLQQSSNDFDDESALDYKQQDLFLSVSINGVANQLQLEYGLSEVKDDINGKTKLNYSQVNYSRQVNRMQSLQLGYFDGVNQVLNTDSVSNGSVNQQANNALAAQESKDYRLGYDRRLRQLSRADAQFEKEKQYNATVSYSMSRLLNTALNSNLVLSYSLSKRGFDRVDASGNVNANEIKNYGIRYNHNYSPKLSYFIAVTKREATQQVTDSVNENNSKTIEIGFVYSDRGRW